MPVPMLDLKAQYAAIKDEIDAAVANVLTAQQFRGGPHVEAFENAVAQYVGAPHAIGVASGTDALCLLLKAIGVESGDEVITTPFTFFATAGAIVNAGGVPVFADIEPSTFNIDPDAVGRRVSKRCKAILPVHLYGQCAAMDAIREIADRNGLRVIEDAAQAIGAAQHGRPAGAMGDGAALSFYPTKNLGAAGEGGMIVTHDDTVAETVRLLRCHGSSDAYVHPRVGVNSHLHTLQAAILNVKLRYLEAWNEKRRANAAYYTMRFADIPELKTPAVAEGNTHVFHQYVIRLPRRDEARAYLQSLGIGCGVFYPIPLHKQECFAEYAGTTSCPIAEQAAREVLALPIHPDLTESQMDEVVDAIKAHLTSG